MSGVRCIYVQQSYIEEFVCPELVFTVSVSFTVPVPCVHACDSAQPDIGVPPLESCSRTHRYKAKFISRFVFCGATDVFDESV